MICRLKMGHSRLNQYALQKKLKIVPILLRQCDQTEQKLLDNLFCCCCCCFSEREVWETWP